MFAEASVIPRTVFNFGLWIDVQEWTFLVATLTCNTDPDVNTISTVQIQSDLKGNWQNQQTKFGVEVAFRHLGHVIFMEKLALVSLFAESSEPVFTHHRLLPTDVAKWTHRTCKWSHKYSRDYGRFLN